MSGVGHKAQRKQLLKAYRENERRAVRDSLPVDACVLKRLFDYLDQRLSDAPCDNTLKYVQEFIAKNCLDAMAIVSWLNRHGGFCDCEVLANVEDVVEDAVPGWRDLSSDHPGLKRGDK